MNILDVKSMLQEQWDDMLTGGTIPVIEYRYIAEDGSTEFIIVDIILHTGPMSAGLFFDLQDTGGNKKPWFSGEIKRKGGQYYLPADVYTTGLDSMLQQIDLEIMEGYILPNNLEDVI